MSSYSDIRQFFKDTFPSAINLTVKKIAELFDSASAKFVGYIIVFIVSIIAYLPRPYGFRKAITNLTPSILLSVTYKLLCLVIFRGIRHRKKKIKYIDLESILGNMIFGYASIILILFIYHAVILRSSFSVQVQNLLFIFTGLGAFFEIFHTVLSTISGDGQNPNHPDYFLLIFFTYTFLVSLVYIFRFIIKFAKNLAKKDVY